MSSSISELRAYLDLKVLEYNRVDFIEKDPISIPHGFSSLQDIEISGFFAAIFAWGQRTTIIKKCKDLMLRMDNAPYQFITQHSEKDLRILEGFKHRTFNVTDLLYTIHFLRKHYKTSETLETAFLSANTDVKYALSHFHNYFFDDKIAPQRTRKHIATPERKSACKRLNMYLRWMVRVDNSGVDFGLWKNLSPQNLICPLDVHVDRTARRLGLLERKQNDWLAAEQLTANLRKLDALDPVKYDFALFGLSVEQK